MFCQLCNYSVLRRRRHMITRDFFELHPDVALFITDAIAPNEIVFNNEEYLCHACWIRAIRNARAENVQANIVGFLEIDEYSGSANTANHCIFTDCPNETRCRIPSGIKKSLLIHHYHYIPQDARVCHEHLQGNEWEQLLDSPNLINRFSGTHIKEMFDIFREALQQNGPDFENLLGMDANELYYLVGFERQQFEQILQQIPTLSNRCDKPGTALGIYLVKLRSGASNENLSALFKMSRRSLERLLNIARECLVEEFVTQHLGFDHMEREDVVRRNLMIPDAIHGNIDVPIVICDGTYVYIQKSSNFSFQRKSYSLHKYDNLLKPFLIVCCNGCISEANGPFGATTSDATILKNMLHSDEGALNWFLNADDVFILDRGFRDGMEDLILFGYEAVMPHSKTRNQDQLTTEQANQSRLVTICGWVTEVVNVKRDFKLFRQSYFNVAMRHMFADFRVVTALLNAFHPPVANNALAPDFLNIINNRINLPNLLSEYVINKNLNRQRATFLRMSADVPEFQDFPVLSENELILFAVGTYQLKLACSYYAEHFKNGIYNIELRRDTNCNGLAELGIDASNFWLLRCRIQSRHARSRKYYSYILVDKDRVGREAISNYYCSCISGKRTLGCCAHIMTIVWFLGYARFQLHIDLPAQFLDNVIAE